jgi:hypothetical protein
VITLYDTENDAKVGVITETQLRFLVDQLEEESSDDQDYYIDSATLEMLQDAGADPALIDLLRSGLAGRDGFEVAWERAADGSNEDDEDEE